MTVERIESAPAHTVSHVFGEIAWLLSQSAQHRDLSLSDLGWLVMPPILNRQFHIFRMGERPIGAALWANFDSVRQITVEENIKKAKFYLEPGDWKTGDSLWLIALIAPFSTVENNEAEVMMADLIAGPFSNKSFNMIHSDPNTATPLVLHVPANAKEELVTQMTRRIATWSAAK